MKDSHGVSLVYDSYCSHMNDWFYSDGAVQFGPVPESELAALEAAGRIHAGTLVWRSGMADWQPYGGVRGSAATPVPVVEEPARGPSPVQARFCPQCGHPAGPSELILIGSTTVCVNCRDTYLQRLREGALPERGRVPAGFWIRFVAACIDGVILWVLQMIVLMPATYLASSGGSGTTAVAIMTGTAAYLFGLSLGCLYEAWFLVNKGATPGKAALSLKVIRADGSRLSWGVAIGRHFAKYLSGLILAIGYIMAAFDTDKRGLHDMICSTRVIKRTS